jgi:hypothetical protein
MRRRAEVVEQGAQVAGEAVDAVGADASRFAGAVVAAQVGSDDAVAGGGQRRDLSPPAPPELRKAVQQDDRRAVCRAGLDNVQARPRGVEGAAPAALGQRVVGERGLGGDAAQSTVAARRAAPPEGAGRSVRLQAHPALADFAQALGAVGGQRFRQETVDLLAVLAGAAQRLADRRGDRPAVAAPHGDLDVGELGDGFDHVRASLP